MNMNFDNKPDGATKQCIRCGAWIIPGLNGCSFFNDCFSCRGGFPDYSRNQSRRRPLISWDELDTIENRCLSDEA